MAYIGYVATSNKFSGTLTYADGNQTLTATTTNVSLEQLADGIAWLNAFADGLFTPVHTWSAIQTFAAGAIVSGGNIRYTGAQPASNADPGQNVANALSQSRAWGHITTDGAGNASVADGYNIASLGFDVTGTIIITFARAFASTTYACTATSRRNNRICVPRTQAVSTLHLDVYDYSNTKLDLRTTIMEFGLDVKGRQ